MDALASAAPTPGGGAAAAWTLAQAAALLAMVCRLTRGKTDPAQRETALESALADALAVQDASERLADLDSLAFQGYGAALKLPKEGPDAAEARTVALLTALEEAAAVPMALHELAAHVLGPGGGLRFLALAANPRVLSDVSVARCLALAALEASKENVKVNLALFKNKDKAASLGQRLAVSEAHALAQDAGESPLPVTPSSRPVPEILKTLPARLFKSAL
ncbi:MAG: cyclodeaminase/cyclohydrolase family protein [bacterium]